MNQPEDSQNIAVVVETMRLIARDLRDDLTKSISTLRDELHAEFRERIDASAVAFNHDFSDLRREMRQGNRDLEHRLEAIERRMDRLADTTAGLTSEAAALTRWANRVDRDATELRSTQIAQQRAIDEIVKRLPPPPQP